MNLVNSSFVGNYAYDFGGAIFTSSDITLSDCVFVNNSVSDNDGGAIYSKSDVKLLDSNFTNNFAIYACGGAIYSKNKVNVVGCNFENNHVHDEGGAVYAESDACVDNSYFSGNFVEGPFQNKGGAVCSEGSVNISNSEFTGNSAYDYGGAIYSTKSINIFESLFDGNIANDNDGGAIYSDGGAVKLIGSNFTNNFAYEDGGAVWSKSVEVNGCSFVNNSASGASVSQCEGGAIYMDDSCDLRVSSSGFYGNCANDKGGAIYCEGNSAHVYLDSYNSFENNTAKEGSVVFADGYFESIKCNWWGECCPDWDDGLLVEWKAWPWDNVKHHDESPLDHNPNL